MNRNSTRSPYERKYPGTCDIDLTLLIAERLAEGDSPVTEAYDLPDEFGLTEAELAGLLGSQVITEAEAIIAGYPYMLTALYRSALDTARAALPR